MTEVLHFPSSPSTGTSSPSSPSPPPISCAPQNSLSCGTEDGDDDFSVRVGDPEEEVKEREKQSRDQLSLLALLVTVFRKSLAACKSDRRELCAMEIGWPTNVRHVVHVTFDRFNGFLGLPVEFEPEVSRRAPSASIWGPLLPQHFGVYLFLLNFLNYGFPAFFQKSVVLYWYMECLGLNFRILEL
ncbi:hypothetical protein SLEP1_g43275 [Rubroshorea leprosula]|uniref:CRIB domain-containing protein n=1 Tax=Rubroshorea leprosula TaxID=152421 RepID=A0AAV5LDI1_9ROSI|nr:hypothetical protein SLEP1_g43275 [Rubroshorea leprosula]